MRKSRRKQSAALKGNVQMTNERSEVHVGKSDFTGPFVYGSAIYKTGSYVFLNMLLIYLDIGCIPYQTMFNCVIQLKFSQT